MKNRNDFIYDIISQKKFEHLKKMMQEEQLSVFFKDNCIVKMLIDSKKEYEYNYYVFVHYYPEILSSYDKVIENFSVLSQQFGLSDALETSILFSYLLWNGYFSYGRDLHYCGINNLNRFDFFGLEVMAGQGCCTHFSYLLKDFLDVCGYDSAVLLNYMKRIDYSSIYLPDIDRKRIICGEKENIRDKFFRKISTKMSGNHAFNLINDSGNLSIYDATNLLYIPISDCVGYKVNGQFAQGTLHPDFSYIFNLEEGAIKTLDLFHNKERGSYFDLKEYEMKSEKLLKMFRNNQDLLLDSYQASSNDITVVSDGIKKIKKLVR